MIAKKVKDILKEEFGLMHVDESMSLKYDLALDYVDRLELAMFLEKKLGVRLPDDIATSVVTVEDLIRKVEEYMPTRPVEHEAQPLKPVAGLYSVWNGVPMCCITGQKCDKLNPAEVRKNKDAANLCKQQQCVIEHNFARLAQKVK